MARHTAATRSPAPRRSRRSSCSRTAWSRTPASGAIRRRPGSPHWRGDSRRSSRDVRGKGLMIGIEFDTPEHAEEVQWACFEMGLLVLECGKSSVRMSPALTVSEAEMTTALRLFGRAVARVAGHEPEVLTEVTEAGALHEVEAAG